MKNLINKTICKIFGHKKIRSSSMEYCSICNKPIQIFADKLIKLLPKSSITILDPQSIFIKELKKNKERLQK